MKNIIFYYLKNNFLYHHYNRVQVSINGEKVKVNSELYS